jgi:putative hydrolase of the HAD superfamily
MKKGAPISALFVDIGGVLLSDDWDHLARRRAARHFKPNWTEMEQRHSLNFNIYDENKLALAEGLGVQGILHADYKFACAKPASSGMEIAR